MGLLLNLVGAIADTYAHGGNGGGGWAESWGGNVAGWKLAQREYWTNDDGRYAPPISRTYEDWQYTNWPQRSWPGQ